MSGMYSATKMASLLLFYSSASRIKIVITNLILMTNIDILITIIVIKITVTILITIIDMVSLLG